MLGLCDLDLALQYVLWCNMDTDEVVQADLLSGTNGSVKTFVKCIFEHMHMFMQHQRPCDTSSI